MSVAPAGIADDKNDVSGEVVWSVEVPKNDESATPPVVQPYSVEEIEQLLLDIVGGSLVRGWYQKVRAPLNPDPLSDETGWLLPHRVRVQLLLNLGTIARINRLISQNSDVAPLPNGPRYSTVVETLEDRLEDENARVNQLLQQLNDMELQ